jgi:hypothetical protein
MELNSKAKDNDFTVRLSEIKVLFTKLLASDGASWDLLDLTGIKKILNKSASVSQSTLNKIFDKELNIEAATYLLDAAQTWDTETYKHLFDKDPAYATKSSKHLPQQQRLFQVELNELNKSQLANVKKYCILCKIVRKLSTQTLHNAIDNVKDKSVTEQYKKEVIEFQSKVLAIMELCYKELSCCPILSATSGIHESISDASNDALHLNSDASFESLFNTAKLAANSVSKTVRDFAVKVFSRLLGMQPPISDKNYKRIYDEILKPRSNVSGGTLLIVWFMRKRNNINEDKRTPAKRILEVLADSHDDIINDVEDGEEIIEQITNSMHRILQNDKSHVQLSDRTLKHVELTPAQVESIKTKMAELPNKEILPWHIVNAFIC